jgi:hypothetical protein
VSQGQTERDMPLLFVDRDRTHLSARGPGERCRQTDGQAHADNQRLGPPLRESGLSHSCFILPEAVGAYQLRASTSL